METIEQKRYKSFMQAIATLEKSIHRISKKEYIDYEEARDSLIKRFEYTADIFWKLLKDLFRLKFKNEIEVSSPKYVFKEAFNNKFLSEEEFQLCSNLIDDRNAGVHCYNEELAAEIGESIPAYYKLMLSIIQRNKDLIEP
jgi:nucleotidyltransferase substrate binding protein (TIGR01987 family)